MTALTNQPLMPFWKAQLAWALAVNFVWINVSEVFRYFTFIMPMMREALQMLPDAAPMNLSVFLIWSLWDVILVLAATMVSWLGLSVLGSSLRNALMVGTGIWLGIFGLIWIGIYNMNLTTLQVVLTALPLAWIEMTIATLVVRRICFAKGRAVS